MLAVRTAYVPLLRWVPPLLGLCIWWHLPSMPWAGMTSPTWVQEWSGSPVQSCTRVDSEMCSKEQKSACPPPSSCVYVWKTPEANISWKRLNHSVCSNSSCLKNPVWGKWDRPQRPGRNNHLSSYQFILLYLKCSQYKALGSDQYVRDCWSNYAKLLHSNGLLLLLLLSINTFFFFKSVFTLPLFSGHNVAVVPSDLSLGKGKMLLFKFYSFTLIIFCFKCLHWCVLLQEQHKNDAVLSAPCQRTCSAIRKRQERGIPKAGWQSWFFWVGVSAQILQFWKNNLAFLACCYK